MPNLGRPIVRAGTDELGDAVRQTIRAYHGSPYDFDAFDFAGHVGRGEGNQAFGHGGYFAEVEDAAKHYKTVQTPELTLDQERELTAVLARMRELKGLTKTVPKTDPRAAAMMDEWSRLTSRRASLEDPPGHMYEVRIAYPEEALLDWDAPMGPEVASRLTPAMRASLDRGLRERLDAGQLPRHADNIRAMQDDPARAPGVVLYEGLAADYAPASASRKLLDAGIPGLRYLDGLSRGPGRGTRNYVMFPGTEDSIRILRKYGLLAPIAGATMSPDETLDSR
jgi:hypothetical protein